MRQRRLSAARRRERAANTKWRSDWLSARRPARWSVSLGEGLVLATCGAALGLVAAEWGLMLLRRTSFDLPLLDTMAIDARGVAFTSSSASRRPSCLRWRRRRGKRRRWLRAMSRAAGATSPDARSCSGRSSRCKWRSPSCSCPAPACSCAASRDCRQVSLGLDPAQCHHVPCERVAGAKQAAAVVGRLAGGTGRPARVDSWCGGRRGQSGDAGEKGPARIVGRDNTRSVRAQPSGK